mmetsp:Transcript_29359/g.57217  ORF Transcript_29359/g.57217 Transcript_29359/m.57217 type:complete len:284 (-) Transcript_29359:339-1190(-)
MNKLRFSALGGLEPCVHAPRLKVACGGDGTDLAECILAGHPGFDVIGAACAEPHISGAQDYGSVRDIKGFQDAFGAAEHPFLLRITFTRMGHRHHLDLLKLVLAQHAGRVAPGGPGLGAEAERVRGEADGQGGLVQYVACDGVGQGHFGGWNEPHTLFGLVAVFAKFGKLISAIHGLIADEDGGVHFEQPVLIHMGVDHELGERAVDTGDGAFEHDKAAARGFGGRFEIHGRCYALDFKVLFWREIKIPRRAPAGDLDVVVLIRAFGHIVCGQVGNAGKCVGQ